MQDWEVFSFLLPSVDVSTDNVLIFLKRLPGNIFQMSIDQGFSLSHITTPL